MVPAGDAVEAAVAAVVFVAADAVVVAVAGFAAAACLVPADVVDAADHSCVSYRLFKVYVS